MLVLWIIFSIDYIINFDLKLVLWWVFIIWIESYLFCSGGVYIVYLLLSVNNLGVIFVILVVYGFLVVFFFNGKK